MSATAADIPPELFDIILYYVCEYADRLLDLGSDEYGRELPNRKEAVKDVAASSLTCVRWAKICRANLFQTLWIKDYEDLRRFSSLVANVPSNLLPVSEYIRSATLVQRIGDRPWLYLSQLQPSLFPFKPHTFIHFQILDSPDVHIRSQQPTHRRLCYGIPRTLPMIRPESVHIINPHFRTPHDLISLLRKFSNEKRITSSGMTHILFSNITWIAQPSFQDNMLFRDVLEIAPYSISTSVESPLHIKDEILSQRRLDGSTLPRSNYLCSVEVAWLTYSICMRDMLPFSRTAIIHASILPQLHLSAQRAILHIGMCLCQNSGVTQLRISSHHVRPVVYKEYDNFIHICTWSATEHGDTKPDVLFGLFASKSTMDITRGVDCIALICVSIISYSFEQELSAEDQDITAYAWDNIAEICADQRSFERLQLHFPNRRGLARFVEARRAALANLDGRIVLLYNGNDQVNEVDFNTLEDIGADRGPGWQVHT